MRPRLDALVVAAALVLGVPGAAFATATAPAHGATPIRLGVVTFYNPRLMYLKYQPLIDYLTATTGMPWELAISGSYESTVESLCRGKIAVAYLGPHTYLRARELCGAAPIVKLLTRGAATFRSFIVVRDDSPILSIADLRGKSFGFGSALSTSSHVVPRLTLQRAGLRPGVDVQCRYYKHHDSAARAVLLGEVDAAGVRDLVAEEFTGRGLRILDRSQPVPNFPFVAAPTTSAEVTREMVRVLVALPASDPTARATIAGWDQELAGGFAGTTAEEFEPLRRLSEQVLGPRWTSLSEKALECNGGDR